MFCPKCGARNEASARICRDCGQVMEVTSEEDPFRTRLSIPGAVIPNNSAVATTPPTSSAASTSSPAATSNAPAASPAATPEMAIDPYATITGMDAIDIKTIMEATANQAAANQNASATGNDPNFDPFSTLKSIPKSQIPVKPSDIEIDPFKTLGSKSAPKPVANDEINITEFPTAASTAAPMVPDDALATVVGMPAVKIPEAVAASTTNTATAASNTAASAATSPSPANTPRNMALMYIGIGVAIAMVVMGLLMFLIRG